MSDINTVEDLIEVLEKQLEEAKEQIIVTRKEIEKISAILPVSSYLIKSLEENDKLHIDFLERSLAILRG